VKKWAHELSREFWKEEVQMASKYMKYTTFLAIKEMQINTTFRFHLTSVTMAIIKCNNNKCLWECSEIGTLIHCWWDCKLVQPLWKAV
jgi:aspartate carbamoyltransferase regulatory subunit